MRFGWRGAIGIAISIACLYFAFRNVAFASAWDSARHANYLLLLLGAACTSLMFPLRARRWRTILDPVAPKLPFGVLWRSTAIGMMVNNVVPLRAGEFARAYALTRERPEISFSTALASLVVDRLFDAIVVLLLLAVGMLAPGFPA
ncbi:MAG: lysylphosphatidylglycerol synthase transmembrane domain-containing protein, partial [Gemmatimonadaceae bacterium]